jgi:hypothetical protein
LLRQENTKGENLMFGHKARDGGDFVQGLNETRYGIG